MNNSLYHLTTVQFKLFFREPGVLFWALIFPLLIAWVLGIAFAHKDEITRTIAVVVSSSSEEQSFHQKLTGVGALTQINLHGKRGVEVISFNSTNQSKFRFVYVSQEEALLMIKRGQAVLIIEEAPNSKTIHYQFDPQNAEAQMTQLLLEQLFRKQIENEPPVRMTPLSLPGSRYIDFLIPGLMAIAIMNSCMWGIGWGLIEYRMKKLLRRMVATPMKKPFFFLSLFLGRLVLSGLEIMLLYLFARAYFDIRIEGSLLALLIVFFSGNVAFAGIAIFGSARPENTQSGNGVINAVTLPMMILSGIFFSYHNFPDWAIPVVQYLPLTLLADSIRSIFIEGAVTSDIISSALIMVITGILFFFSGLKIYKWY